MRRTRRAATKRGAWLTTATRARCGLRAPSCDGAMLAAAVRAHPDGTAVSDPDVFSELTFLEESRALFADPVRQLDARPLDLSAHCVARTVPAFSPCFALPQHALPAACGAVGFLGMSALRCAHDARRSVRSALRSVPHGSTRLATRRAARAARRQRSERARACARALRLSGAAPRKQRATAVTTCCRPLHVVTAPASAWRAAPVLCSLCVERAARRSNTRSPVARTLTRGVP